MTDDPGNQPGGTGLPEDLAAAPSTDVVVRARGPASAPVRRLPSAAARIRGRVLELRQHPGAVASVAAASTLGTALLATGLRQALRRAAVSPARRTASLASGGYILHEVHVIHHVVHHVGRQPPP